MKNIYSIIIVLLLAITGVQAQGTIRGEMFDAEFQESIIGGVVKIEGTTNGAVTDLDGQYSIQVPAGTYNVIHSYVGYTDKKVTGVVVTDGEVVSLGQVVIGDDGGGNEIEEVVITVETQKNSEAGALTFQMNNTKIVDAISAQSIAKTGDSDVAAVVKRVPGVTIEGGKYVFVRGLGDRYSKSILNGMQIPGLDPERNTVQMDIFPTNIIDNVVVYKTFSPDLPGDFSGGMVDVVTKDFPLEKYMRVGVSAGYNSVTTFSNDFISNSNQTTKDLLGFGSESRKLIFNRDFSPNILTPIAEKEKNTRSLNNQVATQKSSNFLSPSIKFSMGNVKDLSGDYELGYNIAANYNLDYDLRKDFKRLDITPQNINNVSSIDTIAYRTGNIGSTQGLLNLTGGIALKNQNNKYSFRVLHTRTGEGTATSRINDEIIENRKKYESITDYFQRSITNGILSGEHYLNENGLELFWANSYSKNAVYNPDRANFRGVIDNNGNYEFGSGDSDFTKEWRMLDEWSNNGKIDLKLPVPFVNDKSEAKIGASSFIKNRDFDTYYATMGISLGGQNDTKLNTVRDLNQLLDPDLIITENAYGYEINNFENDEVSIFNGKQHILSGYLMGDIELTEKLDFIGGLRVENNTMNYKGTDRETRNEIDVETLNKTQLLPSANFVYEVKDFMNLRASYNRTLARPSFKEKSQAVIFDPVSATEFYGNIGLVETEINNYDLRWEYFFTETEVASISGFYKDMKNPIETQPLSETGGQDALTAVNKDEAQVLGAEIEFRKNFAFISPNLELLSFNGNFTIVNSRTSLDKAEFKKYELTNASRPSTRTIVGQSPYAINAGFSLRNEERTNQASLNYNVKGKTLSIVGIGNNFNVYEMPVHRVDFKVSKKFGSENKHQFSLKGQNLLNQDIEYLYIQDNSSDITYSHYKLGVDLSIGYNYSF